MSDELKKYRPKIQESYGDAIFLRAIPGDTFNVLIPIWDKAAPRQKYALRFVYIEREDGPHVEKLVYEDILTAKDIADNVLKINLKEALLREVLSQSNFLIKFSVFIGGENIELPQVRYTVIDDYEDLVNFQGDNYRGWEVGSSVDRSKLTFKDYDGKRCLHYEVEKALPEKTIIFKSFNLRPGRRYKLRASFSAPPLDPHEFVYFILREGKKSTNWEFTGTERLFTIDFGITPDSESTMLEFVAGDAGTGKSCSFFFTDFCLYE